MVKYNMYKGKRIVLRVVRGVFSERNYTMGGTNSTMKEIILSGIG
jgi:hypothetical protein